MTKSKLLLLNSSRRIHSFRWIFFGTLLLMACASKNPDQGNSSSYEELAKEIDQKDTRQLHLCSYNIPNKNGPGAGANLACDQKTGHGCYEWGLQQERNGQFSTASSAFQRACEAGNQNSCYCQAQQMMVAEQSEKEIAEVFRQNCENGHQDSCAFINRSLFTFHKDKTAVDQLKKQCGDGLPRACLFLGWIEKDQKNFKEAKLYFKRGCDLGYGFACGDLSDLQSESGELNKAKSAAHKACLSGVPELCGLYPLNLESEMKAHVGFCVQGFFRSCEVVLSKGEESHKTLVRSALCKRSDVVCNKDNEISEKEYKARKEKLEKDSRFCSERHQMKMAQQKMQTFSFTRCIY
jgi:TPR repeat protein